jgi:TonB family protein
MTQYPQDPEKPSNGSPRPYSGDKVVGYASSGGGGGGRLVPVVLLVVLVAVGGWWWWNSRQEDTGPVVPGAVVPTADGERPAGVPASSPTELLAVDPADPIDGPAAAEEAARLAQAEQQAQILTGSQVAAGSSDPSAPSPSPPPRPPAEVDDVARAVAAMKLEDPAPGGAAPVGDEPLEVQGDVEAPLLYFSPAPEYTEEARRARIQGPVTLRAVIDENGRVATAEVVRGLPMGLDQKAMEAVRTWEFHPATLHGEPVRVYHELTVDFSLE